jgi:hypothetical protein
MKIDHLIQVDIPRLRPQAFTRSLLVGRGKPCQALFRRISLPAPAGGCPHHCRRRIKSILHSSAIGRQGGILRLFPLKKRHKMGSDSLHPHLAMGEKLPIHGGTGS